MLIREVILENFMSYEYARIPLKPMVNVVCGPNGAGKSSILLGVSVALGQSYTERSKKLSDLIRWGKDQARVTLVLDNSPRGSRRPVSKLKKDNIFLTRVLRRDGKYWFELENRAATKIEVTRLLSKLGIDPENMLIIMHQNMVEQFTILSPQEKLRIVEAAVGFESYRKNVLKAQRKLSRILSQEESVARLLESAEQTLTYWREQYDRYQQKKQLFIKRRFLERELEWAKVKKKRKTVDDIQDQIEKKEKEISEINDKTETIKSQLDQILGKLEKSKVEQKELFEERIRLEREKAWCEHDIQISAEAIEETQAWADSRQIQIEKILTEIGLLETTLLENTNPINPTSRIAEIKTIYGDHENIWNQRFDTKKKSLRDSLENSRKKLTRLDAQIEDVRSKGDKIESFIGSGIERLLSLKVELALSEYRKDDSTKVLEKLKIVLQDSLAFLDSQISKAKEAGSEIVPIKSIDEILDEIRVTDGHLAAFTDVSEDMERMYESYSKLHLELQEKSRLVAENREKGLEEVRIRMEAWRTVMGKLLDQVNVQYLEILSEAHAVGNVRLINPHDIEASGLEIYVGFRGGKPMPLNAYTQSGGERSTATMTFLLALQRYVQSPFRAVDEYDIHMDPRNREIIAKMLVSSVRGLDAQYLTITPSQVTFTGEDLNIITVQNVQGRSAIKEVA